MARKDVTRPRENPEQKFNRLQSWYDTNDAEIEGLADWDIKQDAFVEVLLRMLGDGLAVWMGLTKDEDALVITLVDGMKKRRVFVRDSVAWDDFWVARAEVYRRNTNGHAGVPAEEDGEGQRVK